MFYAFAPAFLHHATPFSCEYLNAKMLHTCQNNQIYELTQAVLSRAAKIQHFDISDFSIYILILTFEFCVHVSIINSSACKETEVQRGWLLS